MVDGCAPEIARDRQNWCDRHWIFRLIYIFCGLNLDRIWKWWKCEQKLAQVTLLLHEKNSENWKIGIYTQKRSILADVRATVWCFRTRVFKSNRLVNKNKISLNWLHKSVQPTLWKFKEYQQPLRPHWTNRYEWKTNYVCNFYGGDYLFSAEDALQFNFFVLFCGCSQFASWIK